MTNRIVGTGILILVILLIRRIFWKKCSPNVIYFLWIFVAIRVLLPENIPLELPENTFSKMFVMDSGMENGFRGSAFFQNGSILEAENVKEEKIVYGKALLYILEANQKTVSMSSSMGREKNVIKKRIKSIFKKRNAEAYLVPVAVTCIITILAFVQPTIAQETLQKVNGAEVTNQEAAGIGEIIEQGQKENNFDVSASDSVEESIEKEYEILVENKKDLERGINLHYSNCYITDMKRGSNHYWIDEDGVLWGEGTREYGQLGIIKKT